MRKVYLVGCSGVHTGKEFPVEGELVIGRNPATSQLVYPGTEKNVSGTHCKVQDYNGSITVMDLGSTNGTFLQSGERMSPNTPYTLQGGQGFYLGDKNNMFNIKIVEEAEPVQNYSSTPQPVQPASAQHAFEMKGSNKKLIMSIGAVAAIMIIIMVAVTSVNEAKREAQRAEEERQRAMQELYEEQNKGVLEKTVDAAEGWLDIFLD